MQRRCETWCFYAAYFNYFHITPRRNRIVGVVLQLFHRQIFKIFLYICAQSLSVLVKLYLSRRRFRVFQVIFIIHGILPRFKFFAAAPCVLRRLYYPAVARREKGLHYVRITGDELSARRLHSFFVLCIQRSISAIDLMTSCVSDIIRLARVKIARCIRTRYHRLSLESFQLPRVAHLLTYNPLYIILHAYRIHAGQLSAAYAKL